MNTLSETIITIIFKFGYIYLILIFVFVILLSIYFDRFERSIKNFTFRVFYQERARRLILFSFITLMIMFFTALVYFNYREFPSIEYEEYEVTQQIEKLDEMQNSLENLQSLISAQKEKLINTEKYIDLLKMEKQKLEPIVKANRELVESILTLQKERTMSQVWKDRFIGFVISLLAGLVIIIFRIFWKSWKS